jgi:hypothetical protein
MVAEVRERLAVNEQRTHRGHTEMFNLWKLNEGECKKMCHVEVSDRIAALEDLDTKMEIKSAWETIREIKSLGYYKLKNYKPCFEKGCCEETS